MRELGYKAIGLRIQKRCELLKLTRDELAQKINMTSTFLYNIEFGLSGL